MQPTEHDLDASPPTIAPGAARLVGFGALALLAGASGLYFLLQRPAPPPPAEIAGNPLLVAGREVFLSRCQSCHGEQGRGDGPIAKGLSGPPVGNLSDDRWKHGDRPEDVLKVVREGVPNTSMPPWGRILGDDDTKAVAAYTLFLGGREVPDDFAGPRER